MEVVTPYFLAIVITLSIAQVTASFLSSNSGETSVLSLSVPKISIVKSLEPIDTPSIPASQNLSNKMTLEGISTIIHNLKEDEGDSLLAAIIFLTSVSSLTVRTKGSINQRFFKPCLFLTIFMVSNSRLNTSGSDIYR